MMHTNETPNPSRAAAHRSAVYDALLTELRAHGHEWLSGARNQTAAADTLAKVERVLASASEGLSLEEALARHDDDAQDEGHEHVVLTDDVLELRALAAQNLASNQHMLVILREGRQHLLDRAVDCEATERWVDNAEASVLASLEFAAGELSRYDRLLDQRTVPPLQGG